MKPTTGISFDLWDTIAADTPENMLAKSARQRKILSDYGIDAAKAGSILGHRFESEAEERGADSKSLSVKERARALLAADIQDGAQIEAVALALGKVSLEYPPCLLPGILALLTALSKSYPLVVITNTRWTPQAVAEQILRDLGVATLFDAVVSSDHVRWCKPSPKIFHAAWAPLKIDPGSTIHVGDSLGRDHRGASLISARFVQACVGRTDSLPASAPAAADGVLLVYESAEALFHYIDSGQVPSDWELLTSGSGLGFHPTVFGRAYTREDGSLYLSGPNPSPLGDDRQPAKYSIDRLYASARVSDGDTLIADGQKGAVWKIRGEQD